jgi:chorismate mutase
MVPTPAQPAAGAPEPVEAADPDTDGNSQPVGHQEPAGVDARIAELRGRIDEIDRTLIWLWQERAAISREVGATRIASGGTKIVLSREREVLNRFRDALGADGTQLALLILRAGRGPL